MPRVGAVVDTATLPPPLLHLHHLPRLRPPAAPMARTACASRRSPYRPIGGHHYRRPMLPVVSKSPKVCRDWSRLLTPCWNRVRRRGDLVTAVMAVAAVRSTPPVDWDSADPECKYSQLLLWAKCRSRPTRRITRNSEQMTRWRCWCRTDRSIRGPDCIFRPFCILLKWRTHGKSDRHWSSQFIWGKQFSAELLNHLEKRQ